MSRKHNFHHVNITSIWPTLIAPKRVNNRSHSSPLHRDSARSDYLLRYIRARLRLCQDEDRKITTRYAISYITLLSSAARHHQSHEWCVVWCLYGVGVSAIGPTHFAVWWIRRALDALAKSCVHSAMVCIYFFFFLFAIKTQIYSWLVRSLIQVKYSHQLLGCAPINNIKTLSQAIAEITLFRSRSLTNMMKKNKQR